MYYFLMLLILHSIMHFIDIIMVFDLIIFYYHIHVQNYPNGSSYNCKIYAPTVNNKGTFIRTKTSIKMLYHIKILSNYLVTKIHNFKYC